jgi:hypothetical protein
VTQFHADPIPASKRRPEHQDQGRSSSTRDLPRQVPSITNSPRCAPAQPLKPNVPRRIRPVRVDAWAVPASANWSRSRTTIHKVSRTSRSTDWALPF